MYVLCAPVVGIYVLKCTKYSRQLKFFIGFCWNMLSQLARDKLVCCETYSEERLPVKVYTHEHELYTELLAFY